MRNSLTALFFSPTALLVATIWKEDIFQLKMLHIRAQRGDGQKRKPRSWQIMGSNNGRPHTPEEIQQCLSLCCPTG